MARIKKHAPPGPEEQAPVIAAETVPAAEPAAGPKRGKQKRPKPEKQPREKKPKPEKQPRGKKPKPEKQPRGKNGSRSSGEEELSAMLEGLDMSDLEQEIKRGNYRSTYRKVLRSTFFSLIVVAAVAVLIAVLFLPVLQITGTSMSPTLQDGEIVVGMNTGKYETGQVIAFYYNNSILVKRVIATSGQWVDIDEDGNVYVDDVKLDEPYVEELALGDCDIDLPYQVPDERIFVMGDHRATSVDSRNTAVGCVSSDMVIGRVLVGVWPLSEIGFVH